MKIKRKYIIIFIFIVIETIAFLIAVNYNSHQLYVDDLEKNMNNLCFSSQVSYNLVLHQIENMITKNKAYMISRGSNIPEENKCCYIKDVLIVDEFFNIVGSNKNADELMINELKSIEKKQTWLDHLYSKSLVLACKEQDENEKTLYYLFYIDYNKINEDVFNKELETLNSGYYSVIKDDVFLYHKNSELIGKSLIEDQKRITEIMGFDQEDYKDLLIKSNKEKGMVRYDSDSIKKASYSTINRINAKIFYTINFNHFSSTILWRAGMQIIPLLINLLIVTFVLLMYAYDIKYTDYFTETKNEKAFKKYIEKHSNNSDEKLSIIVFKINIILDKLTGYSISDIDVFYDISKYFKSLKSMYKEIFRLSRDHYAFVLKESNELELSVFHGLTDLINTEIKGRDYKQIVLKGDVLKTHIQNKVYDIESVTENILLYMERLEFKRKAEADIAYNAIVYENNKDNRMKAILERAISNNSIELFFQPIFNIQKNIVEKHEVLMRIKEGEIYLNPQNYIEIAEKEEKISIIDRIIIKKAFQYYYTTKYKHNIDIDLTINISHKSIREKSIIQYIIEQKNKFNVISENITFELTETSTYSKNKKTLNNLKKLKEEGFLLALDDFGSGFSNIEQLEIMDYDFIKIDGCFISKLDESEENQHLIEVFLDIAKLYDVKVIAECVENKKTLEILAAKGVEYAQGYHLKKPESEIFLDKVGNK